MVHVALLAFFKSGAIFKTVGKKKKNRICQFYKQVQLENLRKKDASEDVCLCAPEQNIRVITQSQGGSLSETARMASFPD